jgi:tripartite-type tricarboxylate transporter receptor subunit TctC
MGHRKSLFLALAAGLCLLGPPQVLAADWKPSKTMTMVVTSGTGGAHDLLARAMGRIWPKYFGQKLIVLNVRAAGGALGVDQVVEAKPDGHTIGFVSTSTYMEQAIKPTFSWKVDDLSVLLAADTPPYVVVTGAKSPFKTWDDVRNAKRRVAIASTGDIIPDVPYIKDLTDRGVEVVTASFAKSAETRMAIESGDADLWSSVSSSLVMPPIREGRVRPLFVYSDRRAPHLPDVPTQAELGMPREWQSVRTLRIWFGPPKMPKEISASIQERMTKLLDDPEVKDWAKKEGLVDGLVNGADTAASLRDYHAVIEKNFHLFTKYGG